MIRDLIVILALGLLIGTGQPQARGQVAEDLLKKELERFQGTWQLVSAESDGEKVPEDQVKQIRVKIAGKKHTVMFGDEVIARDISFEIDPGRDPKQVTDTLDMGTNKGKQILGIYRLEGETLTSCVSQIGKPRPLEFSSKQGSGHTLRVFRRVKP